MAVEKRTLGITEFLAETFIFIVFSFSILKIFSPLSFQSEHLLWPVFWVKYLDSPTLLADLLLGFCFFIPFLTFFKKTRRPAQWCTLIAGLLILALAYSRGKAFHSGLISLYFLFTYLCLKDRLGWRLAIQYGLAFVGVIYFNTVIWKLRSLIPYLWETADWSSIPNAMREHISFAAIERFKSPTQFAHLVLESDAISTLVWLGSFAIESTFFLFFFLKKNFFLIPLCYLCFHVGVLALLRINFFVEICLFATITVVALIDQFIERPTDEFH